MSKVKKLNAKLRQVKDWRELKPGELLKVSGGPYYRQEGSLKKTYLAHTGICKVCEVKHNGILVYENNCISFIYMGTPGPGIVGFLEPHKIKKVCYE